MTNDLGADLTSLETRLNDVEQQGVVTHAPSISVVPNASGTPVVRDPLTFDTGWMQHTQINIGQPNPALPNYPSITWKHYGGGTTPYGPAQAIRVGPMCFLTGVVVRTGAAVPVGNGGGRIFMLPTGWRPRFSAMLPCITDGGGPGIAWIDVRRDTGVAPAGGVYFQVGTGHLPAGSGWVHLAGAFPCVDAP